MFTTFCCYLLCSTCQKVLHEFQGKGTRVGLYGCLTSVHTDWKYCWEERGCCWNCWACAVSLVLSYSGLGLLSLHSLWGPSTETAVGFKGCTFLFRTWSPLPSSLRTKHWSFFFLSRYFPIRDLVCCLSVWGPSTKFLTTCEDTILDKLLYLLRSVACIYLTKGILKQLKFPWPAIFRRPIFIQHVQRTKLYSGARTQFAVPPTRIDLVCPSDSECHLLRFLLTAVLSQGMNAGARVTLDTEFFCWCYAVHLRDFSFCRIWVTFDTVYNCWCYASICWNDCEVAG